MTPPDLARPVESAEGGEAASAVRREVVLPPEIPAVVRAIVEARTGQDARRQLARVLAGERFGVAAELRAEAAWVLRHLGHSDVVAGQALGVGPAAITRGRKRLQARLAADLELRTWFEAILPPAEEPPAARVA